MYVTPYIYIEWFIIMSYKNWQHANPHHDDSTNAAKGWPKKSDGRWNS